MEIISALINEAKRKAILFCSEVNSLFTSELANQNARKALFTAGLVYTKIVYIHFSFTGIFTDNLSWNLSFIHLCPETSHTLYVSSAAANMLVMNRKSLVIKINEVP